MSIPTPSPTGPVCAPADAAALNESGESARLMAKYFITYNGRHYQFRRFRYDRLAQAVDYARLQRAKLADFDAFGPMSPPEHVEVPSEWQRQLMGPLDISYQDGVYRLGSFRYDRLIDALRYARQLSGRESLLLH